MYSVLIIDDEPLAREYLVKIVNWNRLNLKVCGEASDGEQALQLIKELRPDIILLDLIMPLMDGLTLASYLKEHEIKCQIIVISGSDEFELVQKSLKLDVKDYILKPFDINELEKSLITISKNLDMDTDTDIRTKSSVIYKLLTNPIDENIEIAKELLKYNNDNFQVGLFYCVTKIRRDRLIENLRNHFLDFDNIIFIKNGITRITALFITTPERNLKFEDVLKPFVDNKLKNSNEILVGISTQYSDLNKILEAFNEAESSVNNGIIFVEQGIKKYQSIKEKNTSSYFYSSKDLEYLIVSLRLGDKIKVLNFVNNVFKKLKSDKVDYHNLVKISNGLLSICYSSMIEKNKDLQEFLTTDRENIIYKNKKIEDIQKDVIRFYEKSMLTLENTKVTKSKQIALSCIKIIEQEFDDPSLSINLISNILLLDESYLRRVFKKETGETINNHIIGYRMAQAKKLLSTHEYKHSDIAQRIGYEDAGYFSKSFKKHVGLSPKEFEISN